MKKQTIKIRAILFWYVAFLPAIAYCQQGQQMKVKENLIYRNPIVNSYLAERYLNNFLNEVY